MAELEIKEIIVIDIKVYGEKDLKQVWTPFRKKVWKTLSKRKLFLFQKFLCKFFRYFPSILLSNKLFSGNIISLNNKNEL